MTRFRNLQTRMTNAADVLNELLYPLRRGSVVATLATFVVLILLVDAAGLLGLWLAIVIIPALARYLILLLEARAHDREPEVPGIELFSWVSNAWSLFPLVPTCLFVWLGVWAYLDVNPWWATAVGVAAAIVLPASFAVLAITHSPLESINPVALVRLVRKSGPVYWIAPACGIGVAVLLTSLVALPRGIAEFVELYLVFAVFAVTGAVIRPNRLVDDIDIATPLEESQEKVDALLMKRRNGVLSHAYGFASRGNRVGALEHVTDWLTRDPQPFDGWAWFFDEMLKWEDTDPALRFAQQYVKRLLVQGDDVAVVKLILRAYLVNDAFRPLAEDRPQALAAAERLGNDDVIAILTR